MLDFLGILGSGFKVGGVFVKLCQTQEGINNKRVPLYTLNPYKVVSQNRGTPI